MSILPNNSLGVIRTQPKSSTHPAHFVELDDLAALLEENSKSTEGFEMLADSNSFEIKPLLNCNIGKKGDIWNSQCKSKYRVLGESKQALFIAIQYLPFIQCFSVNSIRISVFTDTYKDPVFTLRINYNARNSQTCCQISKSSGHQIGSITKILEPGSSIGHFIIRNDMEDLAFRVTQNTERDHSSAGFAYDYDVVKGKSVIANITQGQENLIVYTIGALSCESKVLVLGFAFYLICIQNNGGFLTR